MNARQLDPIAEAAIDWLVRLDSGSVVPEEQAAFARWLRADPRHEAAWRTIGGLFEQPLAELRRAEAHLPGQRRAARLALLAPARRKVLRNSAASLLLLALGGYVLNRQQPLAELVADLRTGTGERRRLELADGSILTLNAQSAVDLQFSGRSRLVLLRRGQLLVEAAAQPERPLIVGTEHGEVHTLGSRFAVRRTDAYSELAVLERSVQVTNTAGQVQRIAAGRAARYDAAGIAPLAGSAVALAAWSEGVLDVRDRPLAEVVADLRPYTRSYLRISPKAGSLRVFGVFPLDDPGGTLAALAETQPIVVRSFGGLLTRIEHRDEAG